MSPTARSLAHLRSQGYLCQVVEHWNSFAKIRRDLFGFADLVAVRDGETLAVQVTTGSNLAARRAKLLGLPAVLLCVNAGWTIHLHGWAKHKVKRGGKAYRYELRTLELTARDYGPHL